MKRALTFTLFILGFLNQGIAQVGIGTETPNASIDIRSSNQATPANNDGILIPKIDDFPVANPTVNQNGMMVFVTGDGIPTEGFYYWDDSATTWQSISGVKKINELEDGKSDNDGSQDGSSIFLGIESGLNDNANDNKNIGVGYQTLRANISGQSNIAIGNTTLLSNTQGFRNVAVGTSSLQANTMGNYNVAMGYNAMFSNVDGVYNSAIGNLSLYSNTSGTRNAAFGSDALYTNSSGSFNSGFGGSSLYTNLDGSYNNAFGYTALLSNTSGLNNSAFGYQSMQTNVTGNNNVAIGNKAGRFVRGDNNTFLGYESGNGIAAHDKSGNVFVGFQAGYFEINSNKLYIENSSSATPLIYGEFDTDLLRVNGTLNINNAYSLPTTDGSINQVLQTDGAGNLSWNDTTIDHKINDLIDGRSDNDGTEDGSSIFLGIGSGENDDLTNNQNVGIGFQSMQGNTTGRGNIGIGSLALQTNTDGNFNTALGLLALNANTDASFNTAVGNSALYLNETGFANTALGTNTLQNNIDGDHNVAVGNSALFQNLTDYSTAVGSWSLRNNTTGIQNTAVGYTALYLNETGVSNTALGFEALRNNIGSNNTAVGRSALRNNTTANANTALGTEALEANTTGGLNTAIGVQTLDANTIGASNTAVGWGSLSDNTDGNSNTALGNNALRLNTTGDNNASLGNQAGYSSLGSGNVFLGYQAGYNETGSSKLYIEGSNANASNALIYGEFDTNFLRLNSTTEINGRTEITDGTDASGITGTGALEIANTLRLDGNEIITNTNSTLFLQGDNNGDIDVDGGTLRVDASANRVGVATTTPDYTLSVSGQGNLNEGIASGVALRVNGSEALWYNGTYFSWGFGGGANYFADEIGIGISNPSVALDVIGSIEYTGTITDVSDRRLKENFEPIENVLERIHKISGYSYNMINDETKTREYGVIAQELQAAFPEMVSIVDTENGYLGVSYIQLIPVLLEGIKEQQTLIENQNRKISQLEATNNSLLADISEIKKVLNIEKETIE